MSPDGSPKPSPEERLLRIIRGKPTQAVAAPVSATKPASAGVTTGSGMAAASSMAWPALTGMALAVLLAVELGFLAFQLFRPLPSVTVPLVPEIPQIPAASELPPVEMPSLALSVSRQLFVSSLVSNPAENAETPSASGAPSNLAKDLVARLTLTGIVEGDPAQAVIEDAENKKTYFVTTGQTVAEGAILEQVLDNRVILSLNGEKISLSL